MASTSVTDIANGNKPPSPVASFSKFLDGFKSQMALALPKHLNADRMARLAVSVFSATPELQKCDPKSIVAGIMTASTLGLEIGVNGQGYLIPYKKNTKVGNEWQTTMIAQFVPGWKGLIDLVSRSGRATVWTGAVFNGDDFDYQLGDSPYVRHRPSEDAEAGRELTHVYAVGRVNGSNHPVIEVWPMAKIWQHRDAYNKVGRRHYSYDNPEMYARKVPLLQVLKYMPASVELSNAITIAQATDAGARAVIEGDFVHITDPETGEITAPAKLGSQPPTFDATAFEQRMRACADRDSLDLMADTIRDAPADVHERLNAAYKVRAAELAA
jgi:recombination protein RecT